MAAQQLRYQTAKAFMHALNNLAGQKLVTKSWWRFWDN
jgi:hypothetical protein